jgi:hypothetical protein
MIEFDFALLSSLGLTPALASRAASLPVREGVDPDRLRNYHKLLREVRRDTLTALNRQQQLAEWKVRGRAVRERMKVKREEA